MMEFSDRNYPWGINTDGCSAEDLSHPKERRKMPFDGCTRDRCKDGATDGELSFFANKLEFMHTARHRGILAERSRAALSSHTAQARHTRGPQDIPLRRLDTMANNLPLLVGF